MDARRGLDVRRVIDVDRTRNGYRVTGEVRSNYNNGRDRYERNRNDRDRRWNRGDSGTFTCTVRNGRVQDVRINGIRGYR